jgi:integrase
MICSTIRRPQTSRASNGLARAQSPLIEAQSFELITTAQVIEFISGQVRRRGLAPKTANRYREIIVRLFNWSMREGGVTMPGGVNPAAAVERYRERAPQIRFLNLEQVEHQLHALRFKPRLQTMVAVLIYAGLRRE